MLNIRDEISKVVDIRIPPGGYQRYLKEIDRTNNLGKRQMLDMLVALFQSVEELQQKVTSLQSSPSPLSSPVIQLQSEVGEHSELPEKDQEWFCNVCNRSFASRIAVLGHSRTHKHAKSEEPTK